MRSLYRLLLWLHPPAFQRKFAGQMLWIFDEARESEGLLVFFSDGLVSLFRQWLIRSESWKVAAAVAGGLLQVMLGGACIMFYNHSGVVRGPAPDLGQLPDPHMPITLIVLLPITTGLVAGLVVMVIALSLWTRAIAGKRMRLSH